MGPALGPLIGGLLNQFLGWRSIFWFLAIYGGVMWLVYALFMPETCRAIVGNGSLPPQSWNRPLIAYIKSFRKEKLAHRAETPTVQRSSQNRPGLLSSIPIILDKEAFLVLIYAGVYFAGYIIIITSLPQQLASTYHFNSIQVGLCYLPLGVGPLLFRPFVGRIMDANFRRYARKTGVDIIKDKQQSIGEFPIERVRLEVALAFTYLSTASIIPYGWVMNLQHPPLAAVLVLLFIVGVCTSASFQPITALMVDINFQSSAASSAALNLVRCLLGAGAAALVNFMLGSLGQGWTTTLIAFIWLGMSACWWVVMAFGLRWRTKKTRVEIENISHL
jgi:MFS family permease